MTDEAPEDDEFRFGLWWVKEGIRQLRAATLKECAAEIVRLRQCVSELTKENPLG